MKSILVLLPLCVLTACNTLPKASNSDVSTSGGDGAGIREEHIPDFTSTSSFSHPDAKFSGAYITEISPDDIDKSQYRADAKFLNMRYVDYLHKVNTGKIHNYNYYLDLASGKVIETQTTYQDTRYLPLRMRSEP